MDPKHQRKLNQEESEKWTWKQGMGDDDSFLIGKQNIHPLFYLMRLREKTWRQLAERFELRDGPSDSARYQEGRDER